MPALPLAFKVLRLVGALFLPWPTRTGRKSGPKYSFPTCEEPEQLSCCSGSFAYQLPFCTDFLSSAAAATTRSPRCAAKTWCARLTSWCRTTASRDCFAGNHHFAFF